MVAVVGTIRKDITVRGGATFKYAVTLQDENGAPRSDLGGATGGMQIRATQDPTAALLGTATVSVNSGSSSITATITDETTGAYTWLQGWYDLELTLASGEVERISEGIAKFSPGVTV